MRREDSAPEPVNSPVSHDAVMQPNRGLFEDPFEGFAEVDGLLDHSGSSDHSSQHDYSALDSDLEYQETVPSTLEHDSLDENDDTDLIDSQPIYPADDPLFLSRDSIRAFQSGLQEDSSECGEDDEEYITDCPHAFDEHPDIQNTYVQVSLAHNFHGTMHEAVKLILGTTQLSLTTARNAAPSLEIPGLETMAQMLWTAEKRLGLNLDDFIVYLFLCDKCWKAHNPLELYLLVSAKGSR